MSTFNLTPKRIAALRLIAATPGIACSAVAERVMPRIGYGGRNIGYTAQGATRTGAAYCIALQKAGLVSIRTYQIRSGYGRVTITDQGMEALASADRDAAATLTPNDAAEVKRFSEYLTDKSSLPADQFAAKWANYEEGKE